MYEYVCLLSMLCVIYIFNKKHSSDKVKLKACLVHNNYDATNITLLRSNGAYVRSICHNYCEPGLGNLLSGLRHSDKGESTLNEEVLPHGGGERVPHQQEQLQVRHTKVWTGGTLNFMQACEFTLTILNVFQI